MHLKHLALLVHDISRARRFYEIYFRFNEGEPQWYGDVLFIRDADHFNLALMKGAPPPNPGAFHHFGFLMDNATQVRKLRAQMEQDNVPILEVVEESDLVSFKCADPDGYSVEVFWE